MVKVCCSAVALPLSLYADTEQATPADTLLRNASSKAERFDGRAFRRTLGKSGRYIRNPINDKDSLALMESHGVGYSTTGLVAQMRDSGNMWQFKDITIKLANAYGYCWGVERAVQMAYEARKAYPGQKLYVTNEIIHNPAVNQVCCAGMAQCLLANILYPSCGACCASVQRIAKRDMTASAAHKLCRSSFMGC